VTVETFTIWKKNFDEEMLAKKIAIIGIAATQKLTGIISFFVRNI